MADSDDGLMAWAEQVEEQNKALRALSAGLCALVEELQEAGLVDRNAVAFRLRRLRALDGSDIPTVEALAQQIERGAFASAPVLRVIPGADD